MEHTAEDDESLSLHSELIDAVRHESIALVVGAGFSAATAELPNWVRAIQSAIDHLTTIGTVSKQEIAELNQQLRQATSPEELTMCAEAIRKRLEGAGNGAGEFASWLKHTFDLQFSSIRNRALLQAINGLPVSVVTTTNYDKLLSLARIGAEGITWREPHRVVEALNSGKNVIHLHGAWDDPESVILGRGDYERLYNEESYRAVMQSLWLGRTLLFIGCSLDGMRDPDFVRLLDWAADTFPNSTVKHYALARSGTYSSDDVDLFLNKWRIQLVPYGNTYEELTPYLTSLAPPRTTNAPPSPPLIFLGRDELKKELEQAIGLGQKILVHGMGGIGKTSLVASTVSESAPNSSIASVVWIDGADKSVAALCREAGRSLNLDDIDLVPEQDIPAYLKYNLQYSAKILTVVEVHSDVEAARTFALSCLPTDFPLVVVARKRASGFEEQLEVGALDETAAKELFCSISGVADQEPLIVQICQVLGGHPLAITLAASRVSTEGMPLASLVARLDSTKHRLETLRDIERDDTPSTSVRASLEVSIEPLPDILVQALTNAAHFSSDCTCGLLALAQGIDVIECEDLIGRLVSASLVKRDAWGFVHMHPLVRSYVLDLSQNTAHQYEKSVQSAFIKLADALDEPGSDSRRLAVDNLDSLATLILGTSSDDNVDRQLAAVRLVISLFEPHGLLHSYAVSRLGHQSRKELIDHVLSLTDPIPIPDLKVMLLVCKANALAVERNLDGSLVSLKIAEQVCMTQDVSQRLVASVKCEIGNNLMELGELAKAEEEMRDGLAIASKSGDPNGIAQLTGQLGLVQLRMGDLEAARVSYSDAKAMYESLGNHHGVAACAYNLGEIAIRLGEIESGWNRHRESLEAEIKADNVLGVLGSLEILAREATSDDRLNYVLSMVNQNLDRLSGATRRANQAIEHSIKGAAYSSAGHADEARKHLQQALDLQVEANDTRGAAVAFGRLAGLASEEGDWASARKYNEQSRSGYSAVKDTRGMYTCAISAAQIAIEMQNIDDAIKSSLEAIELAASIGDTWRIVTAFNVLASCSGPISIAPAKGSNWTQGAVMVQLADAAREGDLNQVARLFNYLVTTYPPAGIPYDRLF